MHDSRPAPTSAASAAPRARLAAALVLVVGVLLVYARVGGFEFVLFDDDAYVYANPVVAEGLTGAGLRWAFTEAHSNNWHPLTWLSHMLDVELFGLDPGAHHWTAVGLHALGALALLALGLRLGLGALGAFAVAALYAWHPLRVESVAWVSERKDVLSSLLAFATLHAYVGYARRGGIARYALTAVLFALGLLAKPMLVTLPFVMLALDHWPLARRALVEKLPLVALAVVSAAVTVAVQRASGAVQGFETIPLVPRLENAAWSVLVYPLQTLAPVGLGILYPHPALAPGGGGAGLHARAAVAVAVVLAVTLFAWRRRERAPWLFTGWAWYLVTLAPVVGVLQVGEQAHADRYATLPTVGLFVALAAWLEHAGERARRVAVPVGAAALLALAVAAHLQTRHWRDTEALYRRSLAVTGGNYQAHLNLGKWLRDEGRLPEALAETRAAVALRPEALEAGYNLGVQLQAAGDADGARRAFEAALATAPADPDVHNRLAQLAFARGERELALRHFRQAASLGPERFDLQANLGRFLVATGELAAARAPLEAALALVPDGLPPEDLRLLARARGADGDAAGAAALLRRLRANAPGDPGPAMDLAWLLATTADSATRAPDEALRLTSELLSTPGAPRAALLPLHAAALAAAGRSDEAARAQREALGLAPPEARARLEQHLARYAAGEALRLAAPW